MGYMFLRPMLKVIKPAIFVLSLGALLAVMYHGEKLDGECPVILAVVKAEELAIKQHGGGRVLDNPRAEWLSDCRFRISGDLLVEGESSASLERPVITLAFDPTTRRWHQE